MLKSNSQKGAVEISTIAAVIIIATVAAAVSIYVTGKYYENLVTTPPIIVFTPRATPTPTPNITADWKVYNDNEIGFEIRYPAEWSDAQETNIDNDKLVTFGNDNIEFVDIRKFELQKNQLFKDVLIQKTTLGEGTNHPEFSQFKLKKIGNENFYYIFPYLSEGQYSVSYWYVKELKVIQFQLTAYAQGDWQSDSWKVEDQLSFKKFNQILSTFKFTGTNETANWQTYINTKYGFEIKYPLDWRHWSDVDAELFDKQYAKNSNKFSCTFEVFAIDTNNFDNYLNDWYKLNPKKTLINIGKIPVMKFESLTELGYYGDYGIKRSNQENFSFHIIANIEKLNGPGYVSDQNCINIFDQILSTFKFTK